MRCHGRNLTPVPSMRRWRFLIDGRTTPGLWIKAHRVRCDPKLRVFPPPDPSSRRRSGRAGQGLSTA